MSALPLIRRPLRDALMAARAIGSNLLVRWGGSNWLKGIDHTGRGLANDETAEQLADYWQQSFEAYFEQIGGADRRAWLTDKTLLEYGPGDFPGAALCMLAAGAERLVCVDRFPLVKIGELNMRALAVLRQRLPTVQRTRLDNCFAIPGDPGSGIAPERVRYIVNATGLAGLDSAVDFAFSRAVLEHVNDLPATLHDMVRALRPGGQAAHLVDLRSHGHHRENPLDFLRWPAWLWQTMHSNKGAPNRCRMSTYQKLLKQEAVERIAFKSTLTLDPDTVRAVRPVLNDAFAALPDSDLCVIGFWMLFKRSSQN